MVRRNKENAKCDISRITGSHSGFVGEREGVNKELKEIQKNKGCLVPSPSSSPSPLVFLMEDLISQNKGPFYS